MRFVLFVILMAFSLPALAATPVKIKVSGLVCDFCAQSITKTFKKEPAVNDVAVNLDKGLVTLDLKDGQAIEDTRITKLMTDSGYTVTGIERGQ